MPESLLVTIFFGFVGALILFGIISEITAYREFSCGWKSLVQNFKANETIKGKSFDFCLITLDAAPVRFLFNGGFYAERSTIVFSSRALGIYPWFDAGIEIPLNRVHMSHPAELGPGFRRRTFIDVLGCPRIIVRGWNAKNIYKQWELAKNALYKAG